MVANSSRLGLLQLGDGRLGSPGFSSASTATGDLSVTLGSVTLSADGSVAVAGTLSVTLAPVTLSSTGQQLFTGNLSVTLAAVGLNANGTVAIAGTLSETLGAVLLGASGTVPANGSLSVTLGPVTLAAQGVQLVRILGDLAIVLQNVLIVAGGTQVTPPTPNNLVRGATRSDFWQTHDFPEIL